MTIITLPLRTAPRESQAEPLAEAAFDWERINDQMELLAGQIAALAARRSALAGAAAAHLVLREHPTAASLSFVVRNGRPHTLSQVMDAQGRILPARRTGSWAEAVLSTVISEDLTSFGRIAGIDATSTSLRIELGAVITSAAAARGPETAPAQHSLAQAA